MNLWYSRPAHRRRIDAPRRTLIAIVGALATVVSVGVVAPMVASADGPAPFGLSMVPGTGHFMIAGNAPGAPLGDATSVSGNFDAATGDFTAVAFASPSIHVVQQVTQPFPTTVTIDQQLIPIGPGSGHITESGDMSLDLTFKLHVDITASIAHGNCYSQPINVHLASTAPLDPTTGQVNLRAEGFNIPNLETTSECGTLITSNAGSQFAGSNNSLELTLQGDLNASLAESTTALAVTPDSPVKAGTTTVMAATVSPAEASGQVDFYAGQTLLGSSTTNASGVATLSKKLDSGAHELSAKFVGNAGYAASTSEAIAYVVQAPVNLGAAFPATLVPGAAPAPFEVSVSNPASGIDSNVRVDFSIAQTPTDTAVGGLNVTPSSLALEYQADGGDWIPVALIQSGGTTYGAITGTFGTLNGFALAPGQTRDVPFRMAAAVGTPKRTLNVTSSLYNVDPGTGAVIGAPAGQVLSTVIVPPASRVDPSAISLTILPGTTGETVARGYLLAVKGTVTAAVNVAGQPVNPTPLGQAEVLIDGIPAPGIRFQNTVTPGGLRIPIVAQASPAGTGGFTREFLDTQALSVGTHTVQLHYFGDTNYKDGLSAPLTFTVTPAWGKLYACTFKPVTGGEIYNRALISGIATLPGGVPSGSSVSIADADIKVGTAVYPGGSNGLQNPLKIMSAQLSPNGVLVGRPGNTSVIGISASQNDLRATFTGATGSLLVEGQPGDVVDLTLNHIGFTNGPLNGTAGCDAIGEPARIGSVTVVGTTLTVTPPGVTKVGQQVTLTAEVKPATTGQIEFFDGDTSLGVVPLAAGKAVLNTGNLAGGAHSLRARYSGGYITVGGTNLSVAANDSNTVEKLIQSATTTSTASTSAQFVTGPATLKATVATSPASATAPTGDVQFKVDGNPIGSPVALSGGQAQLVTSAIGAGAHAVTASYLGTDAFAASTSGPTTVTIGKYVTTMGVAPVTGSNQGLYFKSPAFTATLTSPAGPLAGRTVSFKVGPNPACSAVTNASGVATCAGQVPSLTASLKMAYVATFAGDATATASSGTAALVR